MHAYLQNYNIIKHEIKICSLQGNFKYKIWRMCTKKTQNNLQEAIYIAKQI